MTKSQADTKDRNFINYKEKQQMKRKAFTKCKNCEAYQVFQMYDPYAQGFTTWCWECGSKDNEIIK